IELNPVRAGIVAHPEDYAWSSYRRNTGRDEFTWLVPTEEYVSLGSDPAERAEAYRSLFGQPLDAGELAAIRECVRKGCPFGSKSFVARTEQVLGRPARTRRQGRPRKPEQEKGI